MVLHLESWMAKYKQIDTSHGSSPSILNGLVHNIEKLAHHGYGQ